LGSRLVPYLQLTLAMAIVGSSVVAGKMMTASLPVMLSSFLRFAIASPVLLVLLWLREGRPQLPARAEVVTLFLQSLTGVFLFSVFLLYGVRYTGAIEAGLITGSLPAVTALLAALMLRERMDRRQMLGIASTVAGAILLNMLGTESSADLSSTRLMPGLGFGLVLAAVVCEALFAVLGKRVGSGVSPLGVATAISVFGLVLFLPFALWEAVHFDFSRTTMTDWALVAYFGLVVTVGAFWLFYAGLSKVQASVAGAFMTFLPLSAVMLSNIVLDEPLQWGHIAAGVFVVGGILMTAAGPRAAITEEGCNE
jgi:drug/metabolite transporter (DMT)-like permease